MMRDIQGDGAPGVRPSSFVLRPSSSVLVVGTVGLDTIETPSHRVEEVLGGSAVYGAIAAALYSPVQLVAVAGEDLPAEARALLERCGVGLGGLQTVPGRTFRWSGRYHHDLTGRDTLETQLNVLSEFRPYVPDPWRAAPYVFLANIDPELQLAALAQLSAPRLVLLDSMNYWIGSKREALTEAIGRADVVLMNEEELRQYCGLYNAYQCARQLLRLGPKAVIVKRGPYGATLISEGEYFTVPAYPVEEVRDPTGAGDTFAGGFLGYLARAGEVASATLRRALVYGSALASFAVEDFSVRRLATVTTAEADRRFREIKTMTHFE